MSQPPVAPSTGSHAYAWYMVVLCMVAYVFSFIDRQVIALLSRRQPTR